MRITIIIFALIIIQSVKGQNNIAELKSYLENIEKVETISTLKNVNFDSLKIITTFNELERQIDFEYKHHRILIMPDSGWDLKLNFISKNEIVIYGWISEYDPNKDVHLVIETFKNNAVFLQNYISEHNNFYNNNLTEADFKNQILAEYVVGFGCGIVGQDIPKESKNTLRLVKSKNKKALNKYLTSFSPELQTLGTIGLLKIDELNNEQKRIIEHLKKRNSVILSCSGCLYGIGETFSERIRYYE